MSSEFSPELRQEFLDDFYAECDEHLSAIREGLAAMDSAPSERTPAALDSLLGSVHSLKGISAIVGLQAAEQLAHAMEDVLRKFGREPAALSLPGIEMLLAAAQRLEQLIGAHRLRRELPAIADVLAGLNSAARSDAAPARARATEPALPPARFPVWRCTFAPSGELDRRGVNLDAVRKRLSGLGSIRRALPTVRPGGGFVFIFEVELAEPPPADDGAGNGITWERLEAPPEAAPAPPEAVSITPSHVVRVDLARLDELMRITGELVIHRSRLQDRLAQREDDTEDLQEIDQAFGRSLRDLRRAASRVRLVSIGEIFTRMPFVVRDLARGSAKQARVVLEGHRTEIDKYVAERLKEPLLHLVRNAFTHGLEPAAERLAAGKPPEGTITLHAASAGESAVIRIRDDGRGVDAAAVAARARELGLAPAAGAGLLDLLCLPGFSTRNQADREAGRGMGMAVAAGAVRELGGLIHLESAPGRGTEFILRLPLTLSIVEALIVAVGTQRCVIPQAFVQEIIEVPADSVRPIQGARIVPWRDDLLPLVDLRGFFGLPPRPEKSLILLVVNSEQGATGLAVDRVLTRREVVVRPLQDPLVRRPGISGATELGDGRPLLILDPVAIAGRALRPAETALAGNRI